ncbi:MAG: hypothetical protein KAX40_00040 [Herpetosiphon sp.]|nr:hypothetical protein [Herpetosiphon sp.]
MITPHVQWTTASPLWDSIGDDASMMQRPALLRFATDTFMDDLTTVLQTNPAGLNAMQAKPESFRARPLGADATWQATLDQLKLYQPVHGHFYLVAASLVCRILGLPDKVVDHDRAEKVGFVVRRLDQKNMEFAWVNDPISGKHWRAVQDNTLADFEEQFPLFPIHFQHDDQRRRLLVGLVPTSSRDTFQTASISDDPASLLATTDPKTGKLLDPRYADFETRVIHAIEAFLAHVPADETIKQSATAFIVFDLADFLVTNVATPWRSVLENNQAVASSSPSHDLYELLSTTLLAGTTTWLAAMRAIWAQRSAINAGATPPFGYSLDPVTSQTLLTKLQISLKTALGDYIPTASSDQATTTELPKLELGTTTRYVLRCVYQRPPCSNSTTPRLTLSAPTESFALAPFFDFDAPTRPIRIMMPTDTSISDLRKFNKNVGFVLSNQLRQQMNRVVDLKKVLDGDLNPAGELNLGMLCSFSLPIITICALLVLMIFINLLNIVFWWLPFVKICLPIKK